MDYGQRGNRGLRYRKSFRICGSRCRWVAGHNYLQQNDHLLRRHLAAAFRALQRAAATEGVDIELGDLMADKLGVKARWVNIPFAGLIPALMAGHCDAVISGLYIKPERLKVIDQIAYRYAMEGVLLKSGAAKLDGLEALSGDKVATVTGTTANVLLQQANASLAKAGKKPINIVAFPDNTPALQQVQFGQVKGYALAYETAVYYNQINPGQFELRQPTFL